MLDSFPSPVTPARRDARVPETAPSGQAGGVEVEIFTSFHKLVDALAEDSGAPSAPRSSRHEAKADDRGDRAKPDTKDETHDADAVVAPIDPSVVLKDIVKGGGPHAAGDPHGHHVWTAADLAAFLRVEAAGAASAGPAAAAAGQAADGQDGDAVSLTTLGVAIGLDTAAGADQRHQASDAVLAQALAQRLLVPGSAFASEAVANAAGEGGARARVEDLLKQIVAATGASTDRTASPAFGAARVVPGQFEMLLPAGARAGEVGAPAALALELPSEDTADRIIQSIRMQWAKGGGEAQIRLEPQQFGDVTVSVRVDQGGVVARLHADTAIAREWLQANQQMLRQSLADQHLTLTRLDVAEPARESGRGSSRQPGEPPSREGRQPRRPRTPTGETFDVVA